MLCLVARFGERTLRFRLPSERAAIGSSSACAIPLPFAGVSRQHAWISPVDGGARIDDAGSKNKLIVDGKRVEHVDLVPGIVVQIGRGFVTIEEVSSGELELAVRASTPDPDQNAGLSEDTDDSTGSRDRNGPAAGLRLIRAIESSGTVESVLQDALDLLDLAALLVYEFDGRGGAGISRSVGRLPDDSDLSALEDRLCATADRTPTSIDLPSHRNAILYRSSDTRSERCVVGIRIAERPMEAWESDLYEYVATRMMGTSGSDKRRPDARIRGLSLPPDMIVGESTAFRSLVAQLEAVADTRMDVLLVGETGTGKELLARTLHDSGPTQTGPFIAINCAAIPTELLEAELFGVKGRVATGVDPRVGLFLEADGGSIFLDEIGELAEPLQAKLLRVLQEREVLPLGGSAPRKINVRVIAASNRDLLDLAQQGRFRRDLYYRMSGLLVRVPALRERKEDIPALALGFLERTSRDHRKSVAGISRNAMSLLLEHDWPGNVRELRNEVARAVLFSHDRGVLHSDHFEAVAKIVSARGLAGQMSPPPISPVVDRVDGTELPDRTLQEQVDEVERGAIVKALAAAKGNKSKAARALGITRNGLAMKMKRLGI